MVRTSLRQARSSLAFFFFFPRFGAKSRASSSPLLRYKGGVIFHPNRDFQTLLATLFLPPLRELFFDARLFPGLRSFDGFSLSLFVPFLFFTVLCRILPAEARVACVAKSLRIERARRMPLVFLHSSPAISARFPGTLRIAEREFYASLRGTSVFLRPQRETTNCASGRAAFRSLRLREIIYDDGDDEENSFLYAQSSLERRVITTVAKKQQQPLKPASPAGKQRRHTLQQLQPPVVRARQST